MHAPLGIASYQLSGALPETLKGSLPEIEELEATLSAIADHEEHRAQERQS